MKNLKLILVLLILHSSFFTLHSQVLCIYCYDQNDSIMHGGNNLILNGGFENSNCIPNHGSTSSHTSFCPNSIGHSCDIANWICTGGGSQTYACIYDSNYSNIIEGTRAAYFGNYYANSCSSIFGDTSCLNNVDCSITGINSGYPHSRDSGYGGTIGISLKQTVTGLIIGNIYVLEFWAGGEGGGNYPIKGLFAVDVGFGDTLLRNNSTSSFIYDSIGKRYIVEFKATSTSHTIKFTNWGHICSHCTELVLDDVRLYTLAQASPPVPDCSITGITESTPPPTPSIFPNPATHAVTITTNNQSPSEVILYDITGRKLLHQPFTGSTSLNIETLAKGIYLVEISNEKERVIRKVVKE